MERIGAEEQKRRQEITASIVGTNAMEGIEMDGPTLALFRQWECGVLTQMELGSAIDAHVQTLVIQMQRTHPDGFLAGAA